VSAEGTHPNAAGPEPRAVGWRAVFRDWAHFVRVRGESGLFAYLAVPFENPSLLALWVYRYGYWAYSRRSRLSRILALPHKVLYQVLYFSGQVLFKIAIDPAAEILDDVWLSPVGNILIGHHARVGHGSYLHGWNTLGLATGIDILPKLGDRVHLGPGSTIIGPIEVPHDTIVGPNSIVVRSVPEPGAWLGTPPKPFDGPPERLAPSGRTARGAARLREVV